jgi:hypothetical protein
MLKGTMPISLVSADDLNLPAYSSILPDMVTSTAIIAICLPERGRPFLFCQQSV